MKKSLLYLLFLIVICGPPLAAQTVTYTANSNGYAYLDNGTYKIGFRLDYGGVIDYLSKSNEDNSMINSFDNGRQLGIDAYNGPYYNQDNIYKNQGFIDACESAGVICSTSGSAWNGLPQGCWDGQYGGAPNSVNWNSTTQTLTIESKLWDWNMRHASDLSKIYDEAEQTQVVQFIASNVIKVVVTTSMHISYLTGTYTNQQVSPFMYLNGAFTKEASYVGSSPFTNDPAIYDQTIPYFNESTNLLTQDTYEKWAGLYNESDYGLAFVWKDNQHTVVAGSVSTGSTDNSRYSGKASYLYHLNIPSSMTGNSTIVNEFYLVVGSPSDARCWAYSLNGYSSSCSSNPPSCDFSLSASASDAHPSANESITLNSSCSGGDCGSIGYSWSGNGISGSNSSVTFNAPSTPGTYTYTVTGSKSGCSNETDTVQISVAGGGDNPCGFTDKQTIGTWTANGFYLQARQLTVNGNPEWIIVTAEPDSVSVDKYFPRGDNFVTQSGLSWNSSAPSESCFGGGETGYGGLVIPSNISVPSGYVQGTMPDGAVFFELSSSCTPPSAPSLSASPSTITSGNSSTLSASGCSGGTITWSDGLGTGTSKSVSPTSTKTYTATCSIGGCTSSNGSVTVTVNTGSGPDCNHLEGFFDVANCDMLAGWAYDNSDPNTSISVDIYEGSTLIAGNVTADNFRQDLLDAGKGNGVHGFSISPPASLKDGQSHTLTIKVTGCSSFSLSNSPKTISGCTGGCTPPSAPSLSASPSTITSGNSSALSASGCSGTVTWSDGLGTGTSKSVSPTSTKTYTATCTVSGCTSSNGSVTVTVNSGGGVDCNSLASDVNGANCSYIEGWVVDLSNTSTTVHIDIYDGANLIISNYAVDHFRQDLLDAGYGDGHHGFEIPTPSSLKDGQSHTLTFKVTGCTYELNNSPKVLSGCSGSPLTLEPDNESGVVVPLTVFPNPNKGSFEASFSIGKGEKATLSVTDLQGRLLYRKTITGSGEALHKEKLDMSGKSSGTLLVQLSKNSGLEVKKINVIR